MNVTYEFVNIEHWSNVFASLCITAKEVHDNDRNTINNVIEEYVRSVGVDTSTVGEDYISPALYMAIKSYAAKFPESTISVGVVEFANIINALSKKTLHVAEIACIDHMNDPENAVCAPIYAVSQIRANGDKDDNGNMYYDPLSLVVRYNISQPTFTINIDNEE